MANWSSEWKNLSEINNNNTFTNNDVPTADTFNKTINNVGYLKNALDDDKQDLADYKIEVTNALSLKANASDVYTKTESDTNLSTAISGVNETINNLSSNLTNNYYTRTTINTLLDGKVNKSAYSGNYFPESRIWSSITTKGLYAISFHLSTDTTKIFTCLLNIYNTSSKFSTFVVCSAYSGAGNGSLTTAELIYDNGTITIDVEDGRYSQTTATVDRTYKIANIS